MEVRKMNIKELREQHDMTQEDLAKKIGVQFPAVSKWERGITYPLMDKVIAMAEVFGVSTDVVLGLQPVPDIRGTA
ncbi:MAG: helix-turn-helix transcriptional regulator [Elusimicrobiales bacterium]|nr:helix-turn-helix transcriptional regulator [Elusimicrobiales bacterium]